MKKLFYLVLLLAFLLPGCRGTSGRTTKVVKPNYHNGWFNRRPKFHHGWFDRKKDNRAKRTKVVKMRS